MSEGGVGDTVTVLNPGLVPPDQRHRHRPGHGARRQGATLTMLGQHTRVASRRTNN